MFISDTTEVAFWFEIMVKRVRKAGEAVKAKRKGSGKGHEKGPKCTRSGSKMV